MNFQIFIELVDTSIINHNYIISGYFEECVIKKVSFIETLADK
jgi:hypothetical protein